MQSKRMKVGVTLAVAAAVALLAATTDAFAQRQMTRLGNPGTRFTPPVSNVAALQKTFKTKANQAAVGAVLDKAGLASLTPQVLAAITEGKVTETAVAPGTGIRWMAVRRGGKPDIVLDGVWAGKAPFKAFAFTIEDGAKIYNFVVPKDCGNLALLGQSRAADAGVHPHHHGPRLREQAGDVHGWRDRHHEQPGDRRQGHARRQAGW